MKFLIHNLGCKVNAFEAESVASAFCETGHIRVETAEEAEVAVIFTCAVTNTAAQKSRQLIHRMKRENPNIISVVAGCYAQIAPEALNDAEILVGTRYKKEIPVFVKSYLESGIKIRAVDKLPDDISFEPMYLDHFESQTRAYLKIQDGCNQFCSYCVIPYARGRERSMNAEEVICEAKRIAANHQEIVLAGIHTGRYGRGQNLTLSELIRKMLKELPADFRIRISSIEMTEITDDLIFLMKEDARIARHFHIPLQSGCDATLKRMNRPYSTDQFFKDLCRIRELVPGVSVSTDLIVGFPQETEEEFCLTTEFLKKCEFSFLHVFPYSLRNGTAAEKMSGHINGKVKKKRVAECMEISSELYDIYKKEWIGKTVSVLVEETKDGMGFGHSSEYLPIYINGNVEHGTFVDVTVKYMKNHNLYAEVNV